MQMCNVKKTNTGDKLEVQTKGFDKNMVEVKDAGLFGHSVILSFVFLTNIFFSFCNIFLLLCTICNAYFALICNGKKIDFDNILERLTVLKNPNVLARHCERRGEKIVC